MLLKKVVPTDQACVSSRHASGYEAILLAIHSDVNALTVIGTISKVNTGFRMLASL